MAIWFGAGLQVLNSSAATKHELNWQQAFPIAQAPVDSHFVARYQDARGQPHTLEVWRHGDMFLHRRTDVALDLYVLNQHSGGEARYRLLQHPRKLVADVSRTNLHRIGIFSDYVGLAHVLEQPKTAYSIKQAKPPKDLKHRDCSWHAIVRSTPQPSRMLVCWSARAGLPLSIIDAARPSQPLFEIIQLDQQTVPPAKRGLPAVPPGYALVNADAEIDSAAD